MKLDDLNHEQLEQLRNCTSSQDVAEFMSDHNIELTPDQLELISGGDMDAFTDMNRNKKGPPECPTSPDGYHHWRFTGIENTDGLFGQYLPDRLNRCVYCKKEDWSWFAKWSEYPEEE